MSRHELLVDQRLRFGRKGVFYPQRVEGECEPCGKVLRAGLLPAKIIQSKFRSEPCSDALQRKIVLTLIGISQRVYVT